MVLRHDKLTLGTVTMHEDGYMLVKDAVVTRAGVLPYYNADGSERKELRHPDDVFDLVSLDSLKTVPITIDHPLEKIVDANNASNLIRGHVGEEIRRDQQYIKADLKITHKDAIEAVKSGKRQLSLGYRLDLIEEKGDYNGESYTHRQKNIKYNHLALVDNARVGNIASINADTGEKQKMADNNPVNTIKLDNGLSYEAAPEVGVALDSLTKSNADLKVKLDSANADKSKLLEENTKLKAERDTIKADFDKFKTDGLQDAVKERSAILQSAKNYNIDKADTLSNLDVKKAIINKVQPAISLDGKDDVYVNASYETIIAMDMKTGETQEKKLNGDGAAQPKSINADSYAAKQQEMADAMFNVGAK